MSPNPSHPPRLSRSPRPPRRGLEGIIVSLLALAVAASGCADDRAQGAHHTQGDDRLTVDVRDVVVTRCNEMMDFRRLSFSLVATNDGDVPVVLDGLALDSASSADPSAAPVVGDVALAEPFVLAPGASVVISCHDRDSVQTWRSGPEATDRLEVTIPLVGEDEAPLGVAYAEADIAFMEAWDSCDTFTPAPRPCEATPVAP